MDFANFDWLQVEFGVLGLFQVVILIIIKYLFKKEAQFRDKIVENNNETQKKMDNRATIRAEESKLSMGMMSATASLGIATATAVRDGNANGQIEDAITEVKDAIKEYKTFTNKMASLKLEE